MENNQGSIIVESNGFISSPLPAIEDEISVDVLLFPELGFFLLALEICQWKEVTGVSNTI